MGEWCDLHVPVRPHDRSHGADHADHDLALSDQEFYSVEYQGAGTTTATSTSYIFHGDTLVAYIEQVLEDGMATGTATTYYVHPDHLGSTNVVTDENGDVVQALDYYPYGAERIQSGAADADRTFIGQFGDDATALSYLNARYYDPARGQFTSQDPVHSALGNPPEVKQLTGQMQSTYLSDPQMLNSYSYSRNNPILYKDPEGKQAAVSAVAGAMVLYSWASLLYTGLQGQIRDYELETMKLYPESFPPGAIQKAESANTKADRADAIGAVIGTVNQKAGVAVDVAGLTKDVYDLQDRGRIFQWLNNAGGRFEYITTPATMPGRSSSGSNTQSNFKAQFDAVNRYNNSMGSPSTQGKLQVTSNGAIVTSGGKVLVPAPNK